MNRQIPLEGLSNFRDIGGYQACDRRTVKWRHIFRSDTLANLTDNDVRKLEELSITSACDLRYGDERRKEPSQLLRHQEIAVLELGFEERPDESFLDSLQAFGNAADAARKYLLDNYRQYPFMYARAYRQIFNLLLNGERIVIHCTAGKDRAGLATAIVLRTLGVPEETVLSDYLLTNHYWDRGGRERPGMDPKTVAMIFSACEEYFFSAFDAIIEKYETLHNYLTHEVGLSTSERAQLQHMYLE
ncbi:MAG: Tyrosine-protein phosphatase [Alphaproteobacteria bacterium MarineAlpha4_Bin2]|nr:MAG: Tyrosine-protein phosphatase [Alphaproteobacteria bacterium MarineAlpha4_Bin2]